MTVSDWWTGFFFGPFCELQLGGVPNDEAKSEIDAVEQLLGVSPKSRILDAPCGAGRHSLELARRGHRVTGVDFNPGVIEAARAGARSENLSVAFRVQDIRRIEDEAAFDAALCHWGSFGYFDDSENADFLRRVGRALRPGGRFFLDSLVAESLLPRFRTRDWQWWGEGESRARVLEERHFDLTTSRVESTWTFLKKGREESHRVSIRIYTFRELRQLLEASGFDTFEPYDPSGAPFDVGSSRLRLVASKPA